MNYLLTGLSIDDDSMADENSHIFIYSVCMYNTTTYMDSGEIKFNKGGPWEEGEDRFGR